MADEIEPFLRGKFVAMVFRGGRPRPVPVTYEVSDTPEGRTVRFVEIKAPDEGLGREFEKRSVLAALEKQVLLHVEELLRQRSR